ncbi:MAG TPA: flagellar basal body L-ring protein FlgH [Bryobacteraceae bacterium]|nr:flagellar basal body L-ring protein FlgH [Bryobacteraceae bacterium]
MKTRITLLLLLSAALSVASSPKKKKDQTPEPSPLDKYISDAYHDYKLPEAAPPPGSLWSPNAIYANLGMDLRANRLDDLVTIVVNETFSAVASGDVKTQRQATAQSNIAQLAGITNKTGALANLLNSTTQNQLQGTGETSRGAVLTANLSARVTHVLPNGYLVIEGTKRVQVSSENQVVTVRGVIRPVDLSPNNTILSNQIAQMEIQVNGKGVINDSIHRPNILYRILLGLLPF